MFAGAPFGGPANGSYRLAGGSYSLVASGIDGSGPNLQAPYTYPLRDPVDAAHDDRDADRLPGPRYVGSEDQTSGGSGLRFSWGLQGTE